MPISTEELQELLDCSKSFKENSQVMKEASTNAKNKWVRERLESLSMSFSVGAKILDAYIKSQYPDIDKYQELFPSLQKELD